MPESGQESGPADPITAAQAGAVAVHEAYLSYVHAGFTEEQALQIIIGMNNTVMAEMMRRGQEG